jgi:hypothetical protein
VTGAVELAHDVVTAQGRLVEFVGRCTPEQWTSRPLADDDPRAVAVIVDHVADAFEYLAAWVRELARGEPVQVNSDVVDDLNARHAEAVSAPTPDDATDHLQRSGDAFVALIESLSPGQLSAGDGGITITRFAEIAARHADSHRAELEAALGLST